MATLAEANACFAEGIHAGARALQHGTNLRLKQIAILSCLNNVSQALTQARDNIEFRDIFFRDNSIDIANFMNGNFIRILAALPRRNGEYDVDCEKIIYNIDEIVIARNILADNPVKAQEVVQRHREFDRKRAEIAARERAGQNIPNPFDNDFFRDLFRRSETTAAERQRQQELARERERQAAAREADRLRREREEAPDFVILQSK